MEVIDAEYQWCVLDSKRPRELTLTDVFCRDRRKLTFYFVAEKRIDFRELVRELFRSVVSFFCTCHLSVLIVNPSYRLYKTRIWMASLSGAGGFDQ